jgi:hypothetical protein
MFQRGVNSFLLVRPQLKRSIHFAALDCYQDEKRKSYYQGSMPLPASV